MQVNPDSYEIKGSHSYPVAAHGFEEKEQLLLRNILRSSEKRPLAFRPYHPQSDGQPSLVIVNGDNAEAVTRWVKLERARASSANPISVIYLTHGTPPVDVVYSLGRPFVANRLFALLEHVVTERYGYEPAVAATPGDTSIQENSEEPVPDEPQAPVAEQETPGDTSFPGSSIESVSADEAASAAEQVTTGVPVDEVRQMPSERRRSALVIDQSLPVRIQLRAPMAKAFDRIDVADSGEDALELILRRSYDLVLVAAVLPGIDGYETCKRIKEDPRHMDTPVIMLTSKSAPADKAKGKLAGCETYLIKPVKAAVFETVLYGLLSTRVAA